MRWLRFKWAQRGGVALVLACLLLVSFVTVVHAAKKTSSYADWVRTHLGDIDREVELALETAASSDAHSLDAFLVAFVEAYEAQQPSQPLAQVFATPLQTTEGLIAYLQSRYVGVVGDALLPRSQLLAAKILPSQGVDRGPSQFATLVDALPRHLASEVAFKRTVVPAFVFSIRILSAAQPLGP